MDFPTISHPWYIVQRVWYDKLDAAHIEYYTLQEDNKSHEFSSGKQDAMIFSNLIFAARIASIEKSEIRVLTSKEEGEEFGRYNEIQKETNRGGS